MKNEELSFDFLRDSFGDVMDTRRKKGFKGIFSLYVVFCKADKKDELTDPPIVLKSNTFTILDAVDMDEMFVNCLGEINGKIDEFIRNGSGWVLHHLVRIDLGIVRYNPLKASSYIALPKVIKNRKACINIQNNDQKCFLWCVLAALHPTEDNSNRASKYMEFDNEININGIKYPVKVKDITKFEKENLIISINVFGFENGDIFPLRITNEVKQNHVNLLLISNEENSHYVLVKNLSRLLTSQLCSVEHRKFYCNYCLHGFIREDLLNDHVGHCKVYI